jgi:hypothetical protein
VVVRVFANVPVGKRRSDGFVNATAACQACHKEFSNYYRLEGTTEYVAALARHTGKNVRELIESSRGCRGGHVGAPVHSTGPWPVAQQGLRNLDGLVVH